MSPSNDRSRLSAITRRNVLKTVGGGAVGISVMSGTASAWQFQFYGCSQVCSDSRGAYAVVAVGDDYETRELGNTSQRQNQEWSWESWCYEVSDGEAIVGVLENCGNDETTILCVNPNNCASNYYPDAEGLLADVTESSDLDCVADMTIGSCDAAGTGQGGGKGKGNGGGGKGKGNGGGGKGKGNGGGGKGNRGQSHGH